MGYQKLKPIVQKYFFDFKNSKELAFALFFIKGLFYLIIVLLWFL